MIDSTTYEYLSLDLETAGQDVVIGVESALVLLLKKIIINPFDLSRNKNIYEKRITEISKKFKKDYSKWIEKDIPKSYLTGLKHANNEIDSINGKKELNKINNGFFLINAPPIAPIPEIPGQILIDFAPYANHTQFFGVFRGAAYYSLEDKPLQIMRKSMDIYRNVAVMVGENNFQEIDVLTRRQLSQKLLNEFANKGLQSITYKNGRRVSIDSYCEMLGRTLTGRCALQASINRYIERGYNLGIVSAHFRACPFCTPYEGKILSMDGMSNKHESIYDAELQGLFHPNCKHSISPYFEGLTVPFEASMHSSEAALVNELGYNEAQKVVYLAQEKQRYIERQIRKYKRREVGSLDKKTENFAHRKILDWQAKQRDHLNKNPYLKRKYSREQIKKAR